MSRDNPVEAPDLAALIGSRICHDLISPVGAIGNGVELLAMSGTAGPELALISDSVENANARIRFFRIAFGHASKGQMVGRSEVFSILSDMYRGARLKVHWDLTEDCPRAEARVAFLLLQCLETAMPYGGQVTIGREAQRWRIIGVAEKMKQDNGLWDALSGQASAEVTASQVHFALVPQGLARLGRWLSVERQPERITLDF